MSTGAPAGMPTTRTRGTITCAAVRSPNPNSSLIIDPASFLQRAAARAFVDDEREFLRRVGLPVRGGVPPDADEQQQRPRGHVEHHDQRVHERERHPHRPVDDAADPRRMLQREALGHHLADHDVDEREHRDGQHAGEAVRHERVHHARQVDVRREPDGQPVLAVHAEADARDRDADLRRRDVAILPRRRSQDRRGGGGRTSRPSTPDRAIAGRGALTSANSAATNRPFRMTKRGDDDEQRGERHDHARRRPRRRPAPRARPES